MLNNPHTSLAKLFVEDALWRPGPPATIVRELGQVRKEAAAANDLCAGMWLGLHPTFFAIPSNSLKNKTLYLIVLRVFMHFKLVLNFSTKSSEPFFFGSS